MVKRTLSEEGMPKDLEELARSSQTPLKKCRDRVQEEIRLQVQSGG